MNLSQKGTDISKILNLLNLYFTFLRRYDTVLCFENKAYFLIDNI